MQGGRALSRRALIAVALGGALSACVGPPAAAPEAPRTPPAAPTSVRSVRDDLVARYRGVAPTQWGVDVAGVITRLPGADRVVALTLDACGGPHGSGYDGALIGTLRTLGVPATLFLNSRWIEANLRVVAELTADPLFEIGNHGTRHLPLSVSGRSAYGITGTQNVGEVVDEVAGNQDRLTALLGAPPRFFRSGTAHYDDVAVRIVAGLGQTPVGFDLNGDQGATLSPARVEQAMLAARPGSIVIAHMNHPEGGTAAGLATALPRLLGAGLRFTHLCDHANGPTP